ncbi:hypothetical protein YWS52_22950 [Chitiniphilus shinanonensis]
MDARRIPYVEEFDVVGAFDVLEHIKEDVDVIRQAHKSLNPGGLFVVTVPQHAWLWSAADEYACHERRYGAKEIEGKIKAVGFEIVQSTSFVTALLPFMVVSRFFQKIKWVKFNPSSELNINSFINPLFKTLLRFELAIIKRGGAYPAGGSRLIVARKMDHAE